MEIKTKELLEKPLLFKALTGVSVEEFNDLILVFKESYVALVYELNPERKRAYGGGQKGVLPTWEDKLLFVLFYLRHYPGFAVLGYMFGKDTGRSHKAVRFFLMVLSKSLGRRLVLPKKKVTSVDELFKKIPELKDLFIDGTERSVNRPKNLKKRNKLYSGKKKTTTRKNVIVSTEKKYIVLMSETKSGRRHDKRILDKTGWLEHIPEDVALWTDTGFQGLQKQHTNTIMPSKRMKNRPLTLEQKQNNRIISGIRVVSEHAIGGYKRFKAASEKFRNRIPNLDDLINRICAGLWNLHLEHTT